jgi:uncharacterized membrane protein
MAQIKNGQFKNASVILTRLVNDLHLPVSTETLQRELQLHPDYPSLLAMSETLHHFGIANASAAMAPEELSEIPLPAIVHTTKSNGQFVIIYKIDAAKAQAEIFDSQVGRTRVALSDLIQQWDGVALLVFPEEFAGNEAQREQFSLQRLDTARKILLASLSLLALALFCLLYPQDRILPGALLIMNAGAATISIMLFIKQLTGMEFAFLNHLCGDDTANQCGKVIDNGPRIFRTVTLAELGALYFGSLTCFLLFAASSPGLSAQYAVLSSAGLLFSFYLVFHQAFVRRAFCRVCLVVLTLLWSSFALNYALGTVSLDHVTLHASAIAALLPLVAWLAFRPFVLESIRQFETQKTLARFQRNAALFQTALTAAPRLDDTGDLDEEIVLGNADATLVMTLVVKPLCGPCGETFREVSELLRIFSNDIKVRLRFAIENGDTDNPAYITSKLLMAEWLLNRDAMQQVLSHWFGQKKPDLAMFQRTAQQIDAAMDKRIRQILYQHHRWCKESQVSHTPWLFIGDRKMPDEWSETDLKYVLLRSSPRPEPVESGVY